MRGFSLFELLAALSIAAIIGSAALIYMPDLVAAKRSNAALQSLRVVINFARHTAITRGQLVVVCPLQRSLTGPDCGPRNHWHQGTLVFADSNRNHRFDLGEEVLHQSEPIPSGRIVWRAFRNRGYLVFTPRGVTDWQNGHLLYCPASGDAQMARQLVLNVSGRTYPSRDTNGDGIHEDVRGRPLDCGSV